MTTRTRRTDPERKGTAGRGGGTPGARGGDAAAARAAAAVAAAGGDGAVVVDGGGVDDVGIAVGSRVVGDGDERCGWGRYG